MLTEDNILTALRDCYDPEVKLNLVDLGLIYKVETGPDPDSTPAWPRQWVKVTMTLTTPQCPASGLIELSENALGRLLLFKCVGHERVSVNLCERAGIRGDFHNFPSMNELALPAKGVREKFKFLQ